MKQLQKAVSEGKYICMGGIMSCVGFLTPAERLSVSAEMTAKVKCSSERDFLILT